MNMVERTTRDGMDKEGTQGSVNEMAWGQSWYPAGNEWGRSQDWGQGYEKAEEKPKEETATRTYEIRDSDEDEDCVGHLYESQEEGKKPGKEDLIVM